MFHNVYAFTTPGRRLILDLGLTFDDAVLLCEAQREFMPAVERYNTIWYGEGLTPRMIIYPTQIDPFAQDNSRVQWVE